MCSLYQMKPYSGREETECQSKNIGAPTRETEKVSPSFAELENIQSRIKQKDGGTPQGCLKRKGQEDLCKIFMILMKNLVKISNNIKPEQSNNKKAMIYYQKMKQKTEMQSIIYI